MSLSLSPSEARRLALHSQGLLKPFPFGKGKSAALQTIERIGYVQIDTISVVARAHHHTLWTRAGQYQPAHLAELVGEDRAVFEYWSHAAAYLPMRDYRFSLPRKQAIANGEKHWHRKPEEKTLQWVLDRITAEGPLRSKDFAPPKNHAGGPWWNWKPAKIALEHLFQEGKLLIARREKFQKVYDLPERVLPAEVDTSLPTDAELGEYLVRHTLAARGLASLKEINYLRKWVKPHIQDALIRMQERGEITEVQVGAHTDYTAYALTEALESIPSRIGKKQLHILSPFDNLVIQREFANRLFGFAYQIECYVPQPKRKYGYFTLPLLWGDQFIGRMDTKADRKLKQFRVINLVFEPGFAAFEAVMPALCNRIADFAAFNGCESIVVEGVEPAAVQAVLKRHLKEEKG